MQAFIFCLFMAWTILFGFVFYLVFPDATDALILRHQQRLEAEEDPGIADEPRPPRPCMPIPPPQEPPPLPPTKEDFVPLTKDVPPVHIEIQGERELPKSKDEIKQEVDRTVQAALEDRLIRILVKVNIAACKECSKDDKRIILQLKMMKAFLDGKPALAQKYSKELDKYLKGKQLGKPKE